MRVDWAALGLVTVVSIVTSVIFTVLLATGIRLVSAAKIKSNEGGSGTATVSLGYGLIGIAGGLFAYRSFKKAAPPTPDMAIEEAKEIKAAFEGQNGQEDAP